MAEIIPAILPKSYEELVEKLDIAAVHSSVVQIDICDGGYVPSRTWPYLKGPQVEDMFFNEIVDQEKALPHWEELNFEFDLMINNVSEKIPDFISAGASRIIVHRHSVTDEVLQGIITEYGKDAEEISMFDIELGIAIMPSDSVDTISTFAENIHFVQVMGIDKIGFQGHTLSSKTVELVKAIRTAYPLLVISVDGGVNLETAPALIAAGADRLVVGSALFNASDFSDTMNVLGGISLS